MADRKRGFVRDFLRDQRLLVISVHPDDEVLGCGGLMKKVKDLGGEVYVLYVVAGPGPRQYDEEHPQTKMEQRLEEIAAVAQYLGVDDYVVALEGEEYQLRLNALPQERLVNIIESDTRVSLNNIQPSIVAIPAPNHYHQDHQPVFEAAFAACRPIPPHLKPFQNVVLCYEQPSYGWSVNRLQPNFYVDITQQLDAKIEALKLHRSQLRRGLHVRAPENVRRIAEVRGREVAVPAAEAFITYRVLV
jgi:LmbE family N-acetylglucosaminyl deacetylase